MKRILLAVLILCFYQAGLAQTVLFKPNAATGEDAVIFTSYGCTMTGYPGPAESLNFGTSQEIDYWDWTFNQLNCNSGTARNLIRFTGLNTLPSGITVTNATLRLFGVPTSGSYGNSFYPGSPYPLTNPGWVQRVTGGWAENAVTWNTQPSTTIVNQVSISPSASRFNWNTSLNVTNLVQDILNSGVNDGFLLRLQTEGIYRMTMFASSDYPDSKLWPELEVSYCDPRFTYCSSSNNPFGYTFNALGTGGDYYWIIDGAMAGTSPNLNYQFPGPGTYEVCLNVRQKTGECKRCINLCLAENEIIDKESIKMKTTNGGEEMPGQINSLPAGDMEVFGIRSVNPNPTDKSWKITVNSISEGEAEISLYDIKGNKVAHSKKIFNKGLNSFTQNAENLSPGIYILEVKNKDFLIKEKLVKE